MSTRQFMNIYNSSNFLFLLYILKIIITLILLGSSVLLIISLMIKCARAIVINSESDTSKLSKEIYRRLIAAVILFLIPGFVNMVLDLVVTDGNETLTRIFANANMDYIKERREEEKLEKQVKKEQQHQEAVQKLEDEKQNNGTGGTKYASKIEYRTQYIDGNFCGSYTIRDLACGPTSLTMMVATFANPNIQVSDMTDYICNNRSILNYTIGSGIGEWVLDNKTLLDHFNISGERIFTTNGTLVDYDDNRGQEVLKAVQEGYGVILHVEGHYVVVGQNSSCKQNEVYLYDPAPLNESKLGCATIEEAVRKASNRDSSVHKNAKWKGAYKYTAK